MKITKEEINEMIEEEAQRFLEEEADPNKVDPKRFPTKLSDVDPAFSKNVVKQGHSQFDKNPTDDEIDVGHKPEGVAAVQNLSPSQSSMNIAKAMTFALHMIPHKAGKMDPGGDLGAFISSDNYIMDGHHRWIATAMVDPTKPVGGYLVQFPGEKLVAILNAMTKGQFGVMKGKPASGGFDQFKEGPIRDQLMKMAQLGISAESAPETFKGWQAMSPEEVQAGLESWTGDGGEAAVNSAVTKMVNNLKGIKMETPSWAPERPDMPVIDEPDIPAAIAGLEKGHVDVNPPYAGQEQLTAPGRRRMAESKFNSSKINITVGRLKEIIKEELVARKKR